MKRKRPPNPLFEKRHHTSPSKIQRAQECAFAYFLAEIEGVAEGERGHPLTAGALMHQAIERLTITRAERDDLASVVTKGELISSLEAEAHEQPFDVVALEMAREGSEVAAPRIDLSLVHQDEHGAFVERGALVPVGEDIIAGIKVDMVEAFDDVIQVVDWKTGRSFETDDEAASKAATALYARWAKLTWPNADVYVRIEHVVAGRSSKPIPWSRDLDDFGAFVARTLVKRTRDATGHWIDDQEKRYAWATKNWPAKPSPSTCGKCPFTARCPAYQAKLAEPVATADPRDAEGVVAELYTARQMKGLWERREKLFAARAKALVPERLDRGGRAMIGPFPVKMITVTVDPSTKPRDGYTFNRIDIDDPIELEMVDAAKAYQGLVDSLTPSGMTPPTVALGDGFDFALPSMAGPATDPENVGAQEIPVTDFVKTALGVELPSDREADVIAKFPYLGQTDTEGPLRPAAGEKPSEPTLTDAQRSVLRSEWGAASHPLTLEDGLSRLGRAQVRHINELIACPADQPFVGCSAILNLACGVHTEALVTKLWGEVGGQMSGGQRPRRKSLTGVQLRRLVSMLPVKFPATAEGAVEKATGELPGMTL